MLETTNEQTNSIVETCESCEHSTNHLLPHTSLSCSPESPSVFVQFRMIEEGGHLIAFESPLVWRKVCDEFLERVV